MKKGKPELFSALCFLAAFILWTGIVSTVDVRPVGPLGSPVGLAAINTFFHRLTGVHMALYTLTDYLSVIPLGLVSLFALLGLGQWVKRKLLLNVDRDLLILGRFYVVVAAVFLLFEVVVINHRPVLIEGILETSYPSSTTMLVLCVMPTADQLLRARIENSVLRRCVSTAMALFTGFMVIARFLSGVHWFSDIVGGILLSVGLVKLQQAAFYEKRWL